MEFGIIGLCCVVMVLTGAMIYLNIAQSRALVKLSLDKGYHLIVTDPTGIISTVTLQDRVSEIEQSVSEMREPTLSREVEEFVTQQSDPLTGFDDGEVREITRG